MNLRERIPIAALFWLALTQIAFARNIVENLFNGERISESFAASRPLNAEGFSTYDITALVTESQPANQTAISGTAELDTLTFTNYAGVNPSDYVRFYDAAGNAWAVALDKPLLDIDTVTFPDILSIDDADYLVITDTNGLKWAVAADKNGGTPPTGPIWTAIPNGRKSNCDVSLAVTAEDMAAAFELCFDALAGFSAVVTTDDSGTPGDMTFTSVAYAPAAIAAGHATDDSPTGAFMITETRLGRASTVPAGLIWEAIPSGRKSLCNVTDPPTSSAADVADRVDSCLEALSGLTDVMSSDSSAEDGTLKLTQVEAGPTTNPTPKNADDSGAGSILSVETTPGVAGKVSVANNTIDLGAHGYLTGLKGRFTTSGTRPGGIIAGTDYWLIKVDDDIVKVASSAANALAGTAIDITSIGAGTQTFNVDTDLEADIKLQKSNSPRDEDPVWIDIAGSTQAVDGAGVFGWSGAIYARQIRAVYIGDSSEATVTAWLSGKD